MLRLTVVGAIAAVLLAVVIGNRAPEPKVAAASIIAGAGDAGADHLYGRVTIDDGSVFEGPLRFGGDEEAFWGHYFNGAKRGNPWIAHVPAERRPRMRDSIDIFGIELVAWQRQADIARPFMARFGDIARIDAQGRDLQVTLKSGTLFLLDRYAADDFAGGVRIWDAKRGVVDLDEWRIRAIEFLPATHAGANADRLYGTVRARHGDFTGFIQWDRKASVGSDSVNRRGGNDPLNLRFDAVRSIARHSSESSLVTLRDGREVIVSELRGDDNGNRGVYVDDPRYGRVLVSWNAFERLDFTPADAGPAYAAFARGRALAGTVITTSNRRITGRLVYDLDESESTETLDAPVSGIDYTIPFALVASIYPRIDAGDQHASVMLRSGERLQLERAGDLGDNNAGMLIFVDGAPRPEYVPWTEVRQIAFDR
jgi:hypothetical protein